MNSAIHHRCRTAFGRTTYIVAEDGYAFVMVSVFDGIPDEAHVHDLVVHETLRRRGVGDALMDEAEAEAALMGAERMEIEAETGSWLEGWYERRGFATKRVGMVFGKATSYMEKTIKSNTKREMNKFAKTILCLACFAGVVLAGCETPDGGICVGWTLGWAGVALASGLALKRMEERR